uniref:Transmembrane protein 33 homolog (inferred by orthology to a C. elegans protein) n=1 Tax=Strongyloides venezuelensis TaxID=75913 RepID=A0A0K0F5Y9_STRVS
MVEIREETPLEQNTTNSNNASTNNRSSVPPRQSIMEYLKADPSNAFLCILRIATVFFSILYLLPSRDNGTYYNKAMIAAAVTNGIRLSQRLGGNFQLTREFINNAILEDSFHYLVYSLVFAVSTPMTMALVPVSLFGLLHSINYINKVAQNTGHGNNGIIVKAHTLVNQQTDNLLGIVATGEIFMFPILFGLIFTGKGTIFLPIVYYKFLCFRYSSRRNPYTRIAFSQMKTSLTQASISPKCPAIASNFIHKAIALVERLAPQTISA